jgi:hypothetical protein
MPGSVRRLSSVPNPISAGPDWPARSAAIPSLICSDAFRVRGASGLRCWPEAERPHGDPGECGHRPPRGGRGEHGGQARAEGRVADVGCSVVDRRVGPGVVADTVRSARSAVEPTPFGPPWRPWSEVGVDEAEARGDHVKAAKHAKKAKKLGKDYERHVRGY